MTPTSGKEESRTRLLHPLMGADPGTLVRVLARNGPVPLRRVPQVALALGAALGRLPFTLAERVWTARRLRRAPPTEPPIFIVGHWRSGTTHLYNLLSRDDRLAWVSPLATGMPWDFLGLVKLLRPLLVAALPEDREIDAIPVHADSPQEDEAALANMQPLSFYHGLYFPKRFRENFYQGVFFDGADRTDVERWQRRFLHFLGKVSLDQPGRRVVVKNPVYTGRVARLAELCPGARFVHIHRNPFAVFQSMRRFYHVLFPSLALQDFTDVEVDDVILDAYPRMVRACVEDGAALPEGHYVEVAYDHLDREPVETLERLYRELGLRPFDRARPAVEAYLASIAGYEKNRHAFPREDIAVVQEHWGEFVDRWGYEPPV